MSRITDQVDDAEPRAAASRRGTVVTSHPRAVEAGIAALEAGGSAVDAAVAAACVLGVVDPMSTSLGGDCFALVWNAEERTLHGFNGSGRAPALADAASLRAEGHDAVPTRGWKSITVPGALDAYAQLLAQCGQHLTVAAAQIQHACIARDPARQVLEPCFVDHQSAARNALKACT